MKKQMYSINNMVNAFKKEKKNQVFLAEFLFFFLI